MSNRWFSSTWLLWTAVGVAVSDNFGKMEMKCGLRRARGNILSGQDKALTSWLLNLSCVIVQVPGFS